MYTLKELSTPGTKIIINKHLNYRCQQWTSKEVNYDYTFDLSDGYEIKSVPTVFEGKTYIVFDKSYERRNYYMVPISEFVRVGLLLDEFPEKWQLNVYKLSSDKNKLQRVKNWINRYSQSGCNSYKCSAFKYVIFPLYGGTHITNELKPEYTEITFEQFQKHILKEETMTTRTMKPRQAQDIINSACSTWKDKLSDTWAKSIVLGSDITVDEAFYKEMRGACTKEQHDLFDKIFGTDKKVIEWDKLKTGSIVMIKYTDKHVEGIKDIDKSKPVDIVFYKTQHIIRKSKQFGKWTAHKHYITFHQEGKYCSFSADNDMNYIVDVVQY